MTSDAFRAALEAVVDGMLAQGCPCRFPRFRATVLRDTNEVGAPNYTTWEKELCVQLFDSKVPRKNLVRDDAWRERGECAVCSAPFVRWGKEVFRDAWIEWAEITPVAGDIGAPLETTLPHCWPFYSVGPEQRSDGLQAAECNYPKLTIEAWLKWLAAVANDP